MLKQSLSRWLLLILILCSSVFLVHPFLFQPSSLQGNTIIGLDERGHQLTFRIQESEIDPQDPEQEIYLYTVFYQDINQNWQNLCQPDANHLAKAVVLQGSWNRKGEYQAHPDQVTFNCTNGAIGKCLRFGYKPWKTHNGQSLRDYHQACVRLIRADYCGDGVGHTQDGTPINLYDRLGIQKPDAVAAMSFESAWGVDGAHDIRHTRFPADLAYVQRVCPNRLTKGGRTPKQIEQQNPQALLFNDSLER